MTESGNSRKQRCERFIHALQQLESGQRARLKRCAGASLNESVHVADIFWRACPYDTPKNHVEAYFTVATLFPFVEHRPNGTSFGRALSTIVKDENQQGLDRRFVALLDADEQQLPFRLRQLIMRFKGPDRALDWAQLLHDLTYWHYDDRFVQARWARDYFVKAKPNNSQDSES